jgi:hypothetical protein
MMNGTKLDTLASPFEQQRERFLDPDRKRGVITAGHLVERSRERLPHASRAIHLRSEAAQSAPRNRLAVVKFESRAEREPVLELVR